MTDIFVSSLYFKLKDKMKIELISAHTDADGKCCSPQMRSWNPEMIVRRRCYTILKQNLRQNVTWAFFVNVPESNHCIKA